MFLKAYKVNDVDKSLREVLINSDEIVSCEISQEIQLEESSKKEISSILMKNGTSYLIFENLENLQARLIRSKKILYG